MEKITPNTSILPVGMTSSYGRGRSQEQKFSLSDPILKAVVVEKSGPNQFILDIGGNRLTASSQAPLTPGEILKLQVIKTEPHIELKIVQNQATQLAGRSLTLLGNTIDLTDLIQAALKGSPPPLNLLSPTSRNVLESFFAMQQSPLGEDNGGAILKQLFDNLGLNLEHLLAKGDKQAAVNTLKAALLEMAHIFNTADHLAETTQKILNTLELFQLAQLQVGSESQLLLPLPLPFVDNGYLLVEQQQKDDADQPENQERRFSLHLTMSELGYLRIAFLHNAEGLFIRFHTDSEEKAQFIAEYEDDLKTAIRNVPLINLSFASGAGDPISELIRQLIPKGSSMLDTKV